MLERQALAELVDAGLSDQEIADKVGVSSRTVLRWRKRHGLPSRWTPAIAPHGTYSRYKHHRCRCTLCRRANAFEQRVKAREVNLRTVAAATRAYEPWTPAEDAIVLAHTPVEAAPLLGRSWHACRVRRELLRRRAQEVPAAA